MDFPIPEPEALRGFPVENVLRKHNLFEKAESTNIHSLFKVLLEREACAQFILVVTTLQHGLASSPAPDLPPQVHCYAPLSIKSLEEIDDEHLLSKPAFK